MDITDSQTLFSLDRTDSTLSSAGTTIGLPSNSYSREAEAFHEKEDADIHPIFRSDTGSSQGRMPATTNDISNQATDIHTKQFLEVMKAYQDLNREPNISGIDLDGKHSWNEVLQAAKEAETAYQAAKGIRRIGRAVSAKSEATLPWLGLIPNGFYSSILSGGLKLIFKAFASVEEKRDKGLKTLLRVPEVITLAEECRENFPTDAVLYDKATKVYIAALAAIEGATAWLKQTSIKKLGMAFLLGPLYNNSFKEKIFTLDEALNELKERVLVLRDKVIIRTGKAVDGVATVVNKIEKTGECVNITTKATLEHVQQLSESTEKTHVKIDNLHDSEVQEAKEEAKKAMRIVLEETTKTSHYQKSREGGRLLSLEDVLDLLDVSAESILHDLKGTVLAGRSTDLAADHIAQGVVETPTFKDWLRDGNSASLFIGGGSSFSRYGRITPMSIMSSTVVEYYEDQQHAVAIHFFCGRHTSSTDPLKGPLGMMRSLICQTLRWFPVDLNFIPNQRYNQQLHNLDFLTLCDFFAKIVQRLPPAAVLICIIDNICFFESKEWAESCKKAVNTFLDLVADDQLNPIFKLLMTSPLRSRHVAQMFDPGCRMFLEADDSIGSRSGPTAREQSKASARRYPRPKESKVMQSLRAEESGSEMEEGVDEPPVSDNDTDTGIETDTQETSQHDEVMS